MNAQQINELEKSGSIRYIIRNPEYTPKNGQRRYIEVNAEDEGFENATAIFRGSDGRYYTIPTD